MTHELEEWNGIMRRVDAGNGERVRALFPDAYPLLEPVLNQAKAAGATEEVIEAALDAGCCWYSPLQGRFVRWVGRGPQLFGPQLRSRKPTGSAGPSSRSRRSRS